MGLDPNLAALLAYLFGIVGGLVFFLVETKNKYVRFHAMQSILLFAGYMVIVIASIFLSIILPDVISCFTGMLTPFIGLAYFVLSVVLMIKAYGGEKFKLPIIGDIAEKQAG